MNDFNYTGRVSRKILLQYALSLLGSLGAVTFLALFSTFFFGTFGFWRENLLLRYLITFCRDYVLLLFVLSVGLSWLGCSVHFIRKPLLFLDEMAEAADILTDLEDDESIVLSPELSELEEHLNLAKSRSLRAAYTAREAEQRKNDLVVYLAHDLKTPLTSVLGYLSLLEEAPDMPVDQRARNLHITLEKAYRLEKMINEFFEITRYNSQQIQLAKEPIDLCFLLVQLSDELSPALSQRGNSIVLDVDENLTVCGDADKLARVFSNILKNAATYSYPETEIKIAAEKSHGLINILFQNKGDAIPSEKLPALFDEFYRLDEARISDTGGTGLGLAITKEIILLHDGSIQASSENDTVTFIIKLPAAD